MKLTKRGFVIALALFVLHTTMVNAESLQIGIVWTGTSRMAERVENGFREQITELVPEIDLELQNVEEMENYDELAKIVTRYEHEKDGMVVIRSNGARWLGQNPPAIPTFLGGGNHPVMLGAVKSMDAPEGNITGVTYHLPLDTQFEVFQAILPNVESLLLLLEEGHAATLIDQLATQEICSKLGIAYHEKICTLKEECVAAVENNKDNVSVIIIGANALNFDNTKNIVNAAGKTPVLTYTAEPVMEGALGGFVADDVKLGRMLAESVVDVLVNGKAIKDVPFKTDPKPQFFVNVTTAERLGIEIPYDILQAATIIE